MLVPYSVQIIPHARRAAARSLIYCYERGSEIQGSGEATAITVYALVEVLAAAEQSDSVMQTITDELDRLFPTADTKEAAPSFDSAISQINSKLKANATPLNAVIAHIQDDALSLVHTGKAEAHMKRGRSFVQITEQVPQAVADKYQAIFSEVANGQVKHGDSIFITTPGLLHQMNLEQVKTIIADNTPVSAGQKLASRLSNQAESYRSAAVIIEIAAPEYLAEFANGGQTAVIEITSKERLSDTTKATVGPLVKKFGQWTTQSALPTFKKAGSATIRGAKSSYQKLRPKNKK